MLLVDVHGPQNPVLGFLQNGVATYHNRVSTSIRPRLFTSFLGGLGITITAYIPRQDRFQYQPIILAIVLNCYLSLKLHSNHHKLMDQLEHLPGYSAWIYRCHSQVSLVVHLSRWGLCHRIQAADISGGPASLLPEAGSAALHIPVALVHSSWLANDLEIIYNQGCSLDAWGIYGYDLWHVITHLLTGMQVPPQAVPLEIKPGIRENHGI